MFDNKMKVLFVLLFLSLIVPFGYSTAALQITSHTTIPSTLYPGVNGQLQLSIANSGADPAQSVSIYYTDPASGYSSYVSAGDIGAGANALVSVPFAIPQNVSSGFVNIYLTLNYYTDATSTSVKSTPVSIPLEVSQRQILQVQTLSIDPAVINPGDMVTARINLTNTGGVMRNIVITLQSDNGFSLDGTTQLSFGEVASGQSKEVAVPIRSSSSTTSGKYNIPLSITYQDNLQNVVNQTGYIGPLNVADNSGLLVDLLPLNSTEVGSNSKFVLSVSNTGSSPSSVAIDINQTSVFTPLGSNHIVFDSVAAHQNQTRTIYVGISPSISSGYYDLPLVIATNGKNYVQHVGVSVSATPDVRVSFDTVPQTPSPGTSVKGSIQISNVGNSPIRSLYSFVNSPDGANISFVGPKDKFIGTLNVDDFASYQVTFDVPGNIRPGKYQLPITVIFKDGKNQEHTVVKNIDFVIYSFGDASRLGQIDTTGSSVSGASRRGAAGGLFGLGLIPTVVGGIIILILAFFGYKKYFAKKKPVDKQS